ncbi:8-amino-7-oxononanoate synthase [Roseimicrobium gellanilyticum]|uniref:8-amino-7-oxononanoate synthase n=1 Tax=Roseimicrobium gellanilyticum TaxID=748857 RepID=A0A366HBP1_9BACT|nr:8-amino-7-oxononanoate synthase [Roseimicrobium gellanilyticum]RBP39687.1 8-amino-7-oxononanoate synthase [Roseimicrobium gellanilyticum]
MRTDASMDNDTSHNLTHASQEALEHLQQQGLRRSLRRVLSTSGAEIALPQRDSVINFSSNDYLGLATSEALKEAMREGVDRFGVGSGASRLVCGNYAPHEDLEAALASYKGAEAALAFTSGYATAVGTIPALVGPGDVVILDKLSHASLIDAAKLSGATIRIFPHNHLGKLERLLAGAREKGGASTRVLVVTESIFSMDGDAAPLAEIIALKEKHGAWLLVDEAHAVGVLGPQGRGLVASLGLEKQVELQMGTLSKAIGVSGGYVATSSAVRDLLINRARSLIYSTAPPPAVAWTAKHAISLLQSAEGEARREKLWANKRLLLSLLGGTFTAQTNALPAAILPIIIGDEEAAVQTSAALLEAGHLIPAIRYPTVSRGAARLRLTLSAIHEAGQIEALVACLRRMVPQLGIATHGA